MTNIRQIHRYMTDRQRVLLEDGRTGKIVRVDTEFPNGKTTVSVWTETLKGPAVTKVTLERVVGPVSATSSAA
jgi:hypothetical protein